MSQCVSFKTDWYSLGLSLNQNKTCPGVKSCVESVKPPEKSQKTYQSKTQNQLHATGLISTLKDIKTSLLWLDVQLQMKVTKQQSSNVSLQKYLEKCEQGLYLWIFKLMANTDCQLPTSHLILKTVLMGKTVENK